jgi:aminopeptidase-like protein
MKYLKNKNQHKIISDKFYTIAEKKLFLLNRSITGMGTLKTLKVIKTELKKLKIKNVKSNKKIFDWVIPPEWNVKEAYILDKYKNKILDFRNNNLHLISYSKPIKKYLTKSSLLKKIKSLKELKTAIPYNTTYYKKDWGFCMSELQKLGIIKKYKKQDNFYAVIDSSFKKDGKLNYAEYVIKGNSKQEILISTYICHPSMANNELSGPILAMSLIKYFEKKKINKTLRFIFVPETIGSLAYINSNLNNLKKNVVFGLNLTCLGDKKKFSYIASKYKNLLTEKIIEKIAKKLNKQLKKYSFLERGSDERQFLSPGIDLPIITICRSKFAEYKEYHNSLDNFDFVTKKNIFESFDFIIKIINEFDKTLVPKVKILGEPFLQKRNLIERKNPEKKDYTYKGREILDIMQYCDGTNDIENISKYTKKSKIVINRIISKLVKLNLIEI